MKNFFKKIMGPLAVIGIIALGALALTKLEAGITTGLNGQNDNGYTVALNNTNYIAASTGIPLNPVGTNSVTNNTGWGTGIPIDVSGFQNMGISISVSNGTATNNTLLFYFTRTVDSVNYETTAVAPFIIAVTALASTNTIFYTNFNYDSIGSAMGLRLNMFTNSTAAGGGQVTNLAVYVTTKRLLAPR